MTVAELLELLPQAVAAIGRDGHIALANRPFGDLMERHGAALSQASRFPDCLAPLLRDSGMDGVRCADVLQGRRDARLGNRPDSFTISRRGDWSYRFRATPRGDGGALLSADDVGAFERRHAILAEAELTACSGAWQFDRQTERLHFSDGAWAVLGPNAREQVRSLAQWAAMVHPEDRERMHAAVQDVDATCRTIAFDCRLQRTDGALIEISARGRIVLDGAQHPRWTRGTFQDVTQIREARRALEGSEAKFRAIVENNPDVIAIIDREGRLDFVSPAGTEILGHEGPEVFGHPWMEFIHPDDLGKAAETLQRLIAAQDGKERTELRVRHRNGDWRVMELVASNFLDTSGVQGIVFAAHDVTDRRETENRLRQAQKMEAVGQLTGGIAHDFNNLLAVISGNLELISEGLDGLGGAAVAPLLRMCGTALRATDRGATLTRSLLAFARKQTLRPTAIDLNGLVDEMNELVRRTMPGNVSLHVRPSPGLWLCEVDGGLLQNALLNLVLNARDAMPNGGALTIETGNALLGPQDSAGIDDLPPGEYVLLAVSDTGVGMPPETVARAFDPFFTTKAAGQGTGLGLSMVYGFAKQSAGYARIQSAPNAGTTVRIYLPRSGEDRPAAGQTATLPDAAGFGSERILIVEDDPDVRALARAALQSLGYQVQAVAGPEEALQCLQAAPGPDLLLTDINLADAMDGTELADRAAALLPQLDIVFMSGHGDSTVARNGGRQGRARFLRKPFRKAELVAAIRETLDRGAEP